MYPRLPRLHHPKRPPCALQAATGLRVGSLLLTGQSLGDLEPLATICTCSPRGQASRLTLCPLSFWPCQPRVTCGAGGTA